MPKNTVTDPIPDQEMAFAHLILSGTMTDRQAAEAVGLNPETAAYTKSKPRVRAYITPSSCRFPQIDASLVGAAEVDKKPNFIEFYKISGSLHGIG